MDSDLSRLFERQFSASRNQPPASLRVRRAQLQRLKQGVLASTREFAEAVSADFGARARAETELLEIVPLVRAIGYARQHLARWMKPERRGVEWPFWPGSARVRHDPLGVVGILSPWNYPLLLALAPLADALAAGNRVMLKPSERTPIFSALLQRRIGEWFAADEVCVLTGGVDSARAFARLPFDHLVFTGSTAIGREVMRAAAENLTPVTLELGGKSPAIVAPDYSIVAAARSIAFGKFLNAGQTCIAPDYALVPAERLEEFGRAVIAASEAGYSTLEDNPHCTALFGANDRLAAAVDEARAGGASILVHRDAARCTRTYPPTVVLNPPRGCALMREEIFGPVLPVCGYAALEDALALVNALPQPLALYVFSERADVQSRILSTTRSGGVTLNGTLLHFAQNTLPFGGIGASGLGAYHGRDGFLRFSHARAVFAVRGFNGLERLGPPWGRFSRWITRLLAGGRY